MNWMKDTYQTFFGYRDINSAGCCTGKSASQGGIAGRPESTGLGVFYTVRELLNDKELMKKYGIKHGLQDKTFIIQGFGNVGYWAAKFITQNGGLVVGVAEFNGSIYNSKGFNPDDLLEYKKHHKGSLINYPLIEKQWDDEEAIY
jgi:glutamate dehydrogenase (NAD(P)+)